jgi:hypothetical protein
MSTTEPSMTDQISKGLTNGIQSANQAISGAKESVTNSLNTFSQQSQAGVGATTAFLESNSMIAKVAFVLLVLIGFIILLALGTIFITYLSSPSANPYLVNGMISGNYPLTITQDPSQRQSVYIQRSNNQSSGIEFTWSFWIYVTDLEPHSVNKRYQHVFNKGDTNYDMSNGLAGVNNAPGVYLTTDMSNSTNILHIMMDTVVQSDTNTMIDISNVPIQKWVHVAIRLQNTILDVYINGTINNRLLLTNVPKQNYDNVNICQNGGFSGNLSNLRYFSRALNVFDINSIVQWGPNLSVVDSKAKSGGYYLSRNWYAYNQ